MSDAAAATTAAPAKATKKRAGGASKAKKPADHPKYSEMIKAAVAALKERGGSSRQAILKYIVSHYKLGHDERAVNVHLKLALRAGVKNGTLKQSKGSGASGSFSLGEKKAETKVAKKPKAAKKTKAAGSPKKAKKPAASGAAKKPKAAKKAKSPTKAKVAKPKTAKKSKVAKSPKKAKTAKPKTAKPKKK